MMDKKNIKNIIILSVITVMLLVVGLLLIKGCTDKKKDEKTPDKVAASEDDLKDAYNMSKEDAINKVKTLYNSDVYEFSAEINKDSKYIVTVKNTVTESVTKYLVDPTTTSGSFYMIDE